MSGRNSPEMIAAPVPKDEGCYYLTGQGLWTSNPPTVAAAGSAAARSTATGCLTSAGLSAGETASATARPS